MKDKKPSTKTKAPQSNPPKKVVVAPFKCDESGCGYTARSKGAITAHWNNMHRKPRGQKRGTRKKNQNVGRPTVITITVEGKLVAAFNNGLNDTDACAYAGISRDAYYERVKKDQKFADKMSEAKAMLGFKAREVVAQKIMANDEKVAMWWLERRAKDEFSTRKEVTGDDGGPIKTETKEITPDDPVTEQELEEALFGDSNPS